MKAEKGKHDHALPTARQVRRACGRELYRTAKRLHSHIAPEPMEQAVGFYYKQVMLHLPYIVQNSGNKKKLADWFSEHAATEVAGLWNQEPQAVSDAFREALGG